MIKVIADDREFNVEEGTRIVDFINSNGISHTTPILGAIVNNVEKTLRYKLTENCTVKFIDYTNPEGVDIYRRSLLFLFIKVCEEFYPEANVVVEHSINQGVFCELKNSPAIINEEMRTKIENRMRELVSQKIPFIKHKMTKEEVKEIYINQDQLDKIGILDNVNMEKVTVYSCEDWSDYFFGYIVPNTGYLTVFELRVYEGGFLLRYPQKDNFYQLSPYFDQKKLFNIFSEFKRWNKILNVENISMLNKIVKEGNIDTYIRISEALQEKKYAQIADNIKQDRDKKIILIAGPSSSGKTTSSHRLDIQLRVNGIVPVTIALDDYFVNRDKTPLDENGKLDFESLYAIDLELYNEHLTRLLKGEEVEIPKFNFVTGTREKSGRKVRLLDNQVLIFEGIHALNEKLTESISRDNKYKIYVSALTSINIDDHNAIRTTEARLLRRMVRDFQFRGSSSEKTLDIWDSVRRGEDRNIFPYQEEADEMFNSAMLYEIGVLKPYAEPLLKQIGEDSEHYTQASKLLDFIQYFEPIKSDAIPNNSIIREFIGGSCFDL